MDEGQGRVASVTSPIGTRTYGFGTDVNGKSERRYPTSLKISGGPGGADLVFAGAYNADGTLVTEKLPGGITRRLSVDLAGEPVGLTYSGQVAVRDENGTVTGTDPDGPWLGWGIDNDVDGRVRREWTPAGAGYETGGLESGAAASYHREYRYDNADRLITVLDRSAAAGAGITAEEMPVGGTCETRSYGFDANGNRTSLTRTPAAADGACQAAGTAGEPPKTNAFDVADRLTTAGYVYDAFGRATTIPAVDSPVGAAKGAIGLGYHVDNAIASITHDGVTTSFERDGSGRRKVEKTGPTGGTATKTVTRHYADGSDNPAWTTTVTGAGTATTEFEESLEGDLGLTLTTPAGGGALEAELTIADPHDDVLTTVTIPATGSATGIGEWVDHDEYGQPIGAAATSEPDGAVTDGLGYGWLGAKQRATLDTGLTLMGARVYNRATGLFTSTDPVFGGNEATYSYPNDPINSVDLDGRKKCGKWYSWKCVKKGAKRAGKWAKKHRGTIAVVGATAGCLVPGVGWAACAGMGVVAAGIAAQQSSRAGGRFYRSKRFYKSWAIGSAFAVGGASIGRGLSRLYRWGRSGNLPNRMPAYLGSGSGGSRALLEAKFTVLGGVLESWAQRKVR